MSSLRSLLRSPASAFGLAGLLGVAGVSHFAIPRFYDAIIPHALPGPARVWTLASGVVELACAAAVALPRTRPLASTAAAVLFVAGIPSNPPTTLDRHAPPPPDHSIDYAP